ncbi:hypothetical protein Mesau_00962 [Mesorhizobium australicum WSM2073]|uniref:Uncharacterized protein n=1 Tax=Mesorhizobium australicum (strain HAMBI 3006 / LMG 24608 / WSM2073) TaxID=754035 RepID=L0KFY9_MESAW|nr:hypothetical protein Mesau_00962 [Mesorhizobium australicum WSM2073]
MKFKIVGMLGSLAILSCPGSFAEAGGWGRGPIWGQAKKRRKRL